MNSQGNVLFLILIAVALFAALSYAVTQSSRVSSTSSQEESDRISAAQLVQQASSYRIAVERLLLGGVDILTLSFESPLLANHENVVAGANAVKVFSSQGGAIYVPPDKKALADLPATGAPLWRTLHGTWVFSGSHCVGWTPLPSDGGASCYNKGDAEADLLVYVPWVKKSVCLEINKKLGIENPGGNPPVSLDDIDEEPFGGYWNLIHGIGSAETNGKDQACLHRTKLNGNFYFFYQVLKARY